MNKLLVATAWATVLLFGKESALAQCCQSPLLPGQAASAIEIIKDSDNLNQRALSFHKRAETLIAQADKLKDQAASLHNSKAAVKGSASQTTLNGAAEVLHTNIPVLPKPAKLTKEQYALGAKQYAGDLSNFTAHAKAYDEHLKQFQKAVGECHANEKALDGVLKKYEIHVGDFHLGLNDSNAQIVLRPPHICKRMQNMVDRDFNKIANAMMNDQRRVMEAEHRLAQTEAELQNAEQANAAASGKAMHQAQREEGEMALAGEFGRLKEEYDLLKMEKERLATVNPNIGRVTRSSVSAVIKAH
jgi:hypothetical protein